MRNTLALIVILSGTWLLLSGHTSPLLLSLGLISVAAIVACAARLELLDEEPDEPDEPELDEVDAEEAAVEELDSPLLSVVVCDAVSHAAMKKATATSAIRRCNMLMLPVLVRLS